MSEGYDVGDVGEVRDKSGQVMFGSSKTTAAQLLVNHCVAAGFQARACIPTIDQRMDISQTSELDVDWSFKLGERVAAAFAAGDTHFFATLSRGKKTAAASRARIELVPLSSIHDYSRTLRRDWLRAGQFDVSDRFVKYAQPLLKGPLVGFPRSGLPAFLPPIPPMRGRRRLVKWTTA
jgi:6-phosphofructokinase 1